MLTIMMGIHIILTAMQIYRSWTEIRRGSVLKLTFRLKNLNNDREEEKNDAYIAPFDVDDCAQVRFKFATVTAAIISSSSSCYVDPGISINVSSKLSDSILRKFPANTVVHLNVICKELEFSKEWDCSEQWSDWIEMGELDSITDDIRHDEEYILSPFELTITVSKKETVTFAKLYDDTELTDFQLSTAEGSVSVHKVLLAAHSDVFRTMLGREWVETTNANVQIQGVTLQTLQDLKKYIYLNTLPDNIEELRPLLVLGSHYMMGFLMSECITKIIRKVTPDNLKCLLEHACAYNIPELTFAIIEQTPSEVVHAARLKRKVQKDAKEELSDQQSMYVSSIDLENDDVE